MENKQRKKSALDRFMAWLLMVLQNSFIGRFFTSYDKVNDKFQASIRKKSKRGERKLARLIEHSGVAGFIPKISVPYADSVKGLWHYDAYDGCRRYNFVSY